MRVTLRPDAATGLTAAQMLTVAPRLRAREASLRESAGSASAREAKRLVAQADQMSADAPIWEAAAEQMDAEGVEGRWSIDWEAAALMEADPVEAAIVSLREYGARNSKSDLGTIQAAHDALHRLGAKCSGDDEAAEDGPMMREAMVTLEGAATDVRFAESGMSGLMTLREAAADFDDETKSVWITPIKPGFGNKRDGFYYPVETVREATLSGQFDGVKMFANHPSKTQERDLPERSVQDWVGVVKESVWDEDRQRPRSRVQVLDDSVYAKWKAAPEHIAFSVLGAGVARPGHVNGEAARIVESVKGIRSVDWVTQAGAGGGIDFRESAAEEFDMDLSKMTAAQFREALRARPDLWVALREETEPPAEDEAEVSGLARGAMETPEVAADDPGTDEVEEPVEAEPVPPTDLAGRPIPEGYVSRAEYEALAAQVDAQAVRESALSAREWAQQVVEEMLSETVLPRAAKDYLTNAFSEATVGDGFAYSETELREAVSHEVSQMEVIVGKRRGSQVRGLGTAEEPEVPRATSLRESMESSLMDRVARSDALPADIAESGSAAGAPTASAAGRSVEARMAGRF